MNEAKRRILDHVDRDRRLPLRAGTISLVRIAACLLGLSGLLAGPASAFNVKMHHYDVQRTGWNSFEKWLNVANVTSGLTSTTVPLVDTKFPNDNRIDAQPLFLENLTINGGAHDVVYVATELNWVYAIDAKTGTILQQRQLGDSVPQAALPGTCQSTGVQNGIAGTPVISRSVAMPGGVTGAMWLISYQYINKVPVYKLYALNLATLADILPPVTVQASSKRLNGTVVSFSAVNSKQRPALLYQGGVVYAAFGSHCDLAGDVSRGWVLGWNGANLKPLVHPELTNKLNSINDPPGTRLLTEIWMSGAGPAASTDGQWIYFVTGNTSKYDPPSDTLATYNSKNNPSHSVLKMDLHLNAVDDFFTPSDVNHLDAADYDLSAGGLVIVPNQTGPKPHMAVIAGKDGRMFLLDADNLGKFAGTGNPDMVLGTYPIGMCFCMPSYYVASDGKPRIISSAGIAGTAQVVSWNLNSAVPSLTQEWGPIGLPSGSRTGLFTSVSSNGTKAGTGIIWAVTHPVDVTQSDVIKLYAINPTNGNEIWSGAAGNWPDRRANNTVPVVANAHVFVASFNQLRIFGLPAGAAVAGQAAKAGVQTAALTAPVPPVELAPGEHEISGTVDSLDGNVFSMRDRSGRLLKVDMSRGQDADTAVSPFVGGAVEVRGKYDRSGTLQADVVLYADDSAKYWAPDR